MRVLVCGGRDYNDVQHVYRELDGLHAMARHDCMIVIQGGATGADKLARQWCMDRTVEYLNFPADWEKYGRAAGPIRNEKMILVGAPDMVLAFPGGRGTADMVSKADAAGVPVRRC